MITVEDEATSVRVAVERDGGPAAQLVLSRYDELADLLGAADDPDTERWSAADAATTFAAQRMVNAEARLLDTHRFAAWLDGWTDDAVLWVPLTATVHPAEDQALLLDDRRRLGDRVRWRGERTAWGQQPPSVTVRTVGTVEAWVSRLAPQRLLVRSSLTLVEHRVGAVEVLAGHQVHELVGADLARRTKVIVLPALAVGVRNISFLL
ncbi:MAG: aromatic-ring-hydroxylating dioxygenase subunit beta [Ilumatobacteraceae bacterium]